jgi:alpha-glucosidase
VRCALLLLLGLRGTPVLYYGDEIGMVDTPIPFEELRDPVGKRFWPAATGRDPARTPMQWQATAGAGFTKADTDPWLRFGDNRNLNVAAQRDDSGSLLHFCRDLIALRRSHQEFGHGDSTALDAPPGVLAWRRGRRFVVALNLTEAEASLSGAAGHVRIGTDRARDGEATGAAFRLRPWEGALVETPQ